MMAYSIDASIPQQVKPFDFGRGFDLMQQAKLNNAKLEEHKFAMQKLREDYDLAKEQRKQQKAMQMGIASDLAGIQSGSPAQYAPTRFEQTPQRGQMPQGMTGVMMREQGQQMPQPQAFGEEILQGNFNQGGGGEVTQEAIAGRQPTYPEMLAIGLKQAMLAQDDKKIMEYAKELNSIKKDTNEYYGGLTEGIDPKTGQPVLLAMTKTGAVPSGYAPRPKEITAQDRWRQQFDERKFKAEQDKSAKELAQGQQKIEIERTKVGTESSDNAIDPNAPWAKVANPKEREKLKATVAIKDNARLDELRDAVTRSRANLRDMQRFSELNQRTGTGGINEKYNPVTFNADKQEMEAIEARLTPQMRPIGSGATSDFEGKMYGRGIPQVSKSGTANREIRLTAERAMKLGEAELAFKEQFLQENGYLPKDSQTNEFLRQFESQGKINHGDTLSQLPATAPKGAVAKNAQTGKPEYIFNGSKWIPVGGSK